MPGRYWSEEEERKLADMVASGLSPYKIAKELPGRSVGAIREKIRRMGLVVVRGEGGSSTTRSLPSAEILTHEQVLEVLAEALENDLGDEAINIEDVEIDPSKPLVDTLGETWTKAWNC